MNDDAGKAMAVWPAVPMDNERPLSTMSIWHRIEPPKPSYGLTKRALQAAVRDGVLECIGCAQGPQFYRYRPVDDWYEPSSAPSPPDGPK